MPIGATGLTFLMPYLGIVPQVVLWIAFAGLVFLLQRDALRANRIGGTVMVMTGCLIGAATGSHAADLALLALHGRQVQVVTVQDAVFHKNYRDPQDSYYTCKVTHLDGSPVPGGPTTNCRDRHAGETLTVLEDPEGRVGPAEPGALAAIVPDSSLLVLFSLISVVSALIAVSSDAGRRRRYPVVLPAPAVVPAPTPAPVPMKDPDESAAPNEA
ncbi:hypothetical protein ACIGXM_35210 [Kitasatospora sp. NPDC052896]|uniref:hypothetical protein n=1 Tax=Kitasatospora sp. NPDC052896 TaxID=3364061 RepID=UPI0037C5340D